MVRDFEQARYMRDEDLGVELLSAHYVTHRFGLHTHDTYVIGVVVDGAARFTSGGNSYVSPRGTVMLIEPEEAHTGAAGADSGWTYRMLYPAPALLRRVAEQMTAAPARTPTFQPRVIQDPQLAHALCSAHAAIERRADALEKESRLLHAFGLLIQRYRRLGQADFTAVISETMPLSPRKGHWNALAHTRSAVASPRPDERWSTSAAAREASRCSSRAS